MSLPSHFSEGDVFTQHSIDFMTWLKRSPGVSVSSKIQIADLRARNAGRGVVASQDISEDEELFTIPRGLVLSVQNSKASELLGLEHEDLGPWMALMVVMIYEFLQGEVSPWAPYFGVLPTNFDTLMFWTDSELHELQGSAVVNKVGKKEADAEIIELVVPLVGKHPDLFPLPSGLSSDSEEGQDFLLKLAHRMGSLIMAYAFDIEKDENDEDDREGEDGYETDEDEEQLPKGMVPLADILNADADRNNARLFQEDDAFVMKSIAPIPAGEEIFNDYGELPTADLLRRYGYVTDNYAKYDVVEIPLETICEFAGVQNGEPGPHIPQLEFLDDAGLLEDGYSIPRFPSETPLAQALPKEFLTVYRALKMPGDQLSSLRSNNKLPRGAMSHDDATSLAELMRGRMRDYHTTLQEETAALLDLQAQQETDTFHRRRIMAIKVRQGEKEILQQLVEALEDYSAQNQRGQVNKRTREEPASEKEPKRKRP